MKLSPKKAKMLLTDLKNSGQWRDYIFCLIVMNTVLKAPEVIYLKVKNVAEKPGYIVGTDKNGNTVEIQLAPAVTSEIEKYLNNKAFIKDRYNQEEYLFKANIKTPNDGQPVLRQAIYESINSLCRQHFGANKLGIGSVNDKSLKSVYNDRAIAFYKDIMEKTPFVSDFIAED